MNMEFRGYDAERLDKMTAEMEKVFESKGISKRDYIRFGALIAIDAFYIKTEEGMTDEDTLDMLFDVLESTNEEWEEE